MEQKEKWINETELRFRMDALKASEGIPNKLIDIVIEAIKECKEMQPVPTIPCKAGDKVYVIEENCACEHCPHGKEMNYDVIKCIKTEYECPPGIYSVKEKICEGYIISRNGVSGPGEFIDHEGFSEIYGCDDMVYYSKDDADAIACIYNKTRWKKTTFQGQKIK